MASKTIREIVEQWHADHFSFLDKVAQDQLIADLVRRELELKELLSAVYEDAEDAEDGWLISSQALQKVEDALWEKVEDAPGK